jgi:beta-N-acetylhexosaminidase
MAERVPPEGDEEFEWTDAPPRPPPRREPPDTGERELAGTGARERTGTGERDRIEPREDTSSPTGEEDPFATGERGPVRERRFGRGRRSDTEERRRIRGETGEFERSGRRPPPGRRSRHRDLPARVRRRQAAVVGLIAVALVIGLIALVSGSGDGGEEQPLALKRLVGQTIVAQLGSGDPDPELVRRVRKGQVGGVIVEGRNPEAVQSAVAQLQQAASAGGNPPLLVMIDQEGGPVKRLEDGPPETSARQLGAAGDADAARQEGETTASFLSGLGVNVDLAPVLDVSEPPQTDGSIAARTFGDDPAVVADVGVAFAEGLQDGGVLATAKHFPGLGRATQTTDEQPVSIAATTADLQADLEPFREAIEAGVAMVMVSTASYPNLGAKKQAAFSPAIVQGLLRDELGFDGVVVTDDLEAPAVTSVTTPGLAAANALKAGDDLLLYAGSGGGSGQAFGSLVSQVKRGNLDREPIEEAYNRITSLKESLSG